MKKLIVEEGDDTGPKVQKERLDVIPSLYDILPSITDRPTIGYDRYKSQISNPFTTRQEPTG